MESERKDELAKFWEDYFKDPERRDEALFASATEIGRSWMT